MELIDETTKYLRRVNRNKNGIRHFGEYINAQKNKKRGGYKRK